MRLALALLVMLAPAARAQRGHDIRAQIRDSVEAWRARNHQPTGMAVGVYWQGKAILAQTYGTTQLGSHAPVTARSIFHLASVTKPFVATAVMQLADAGRVDIDAPVTRYLPYFKMKDPLERYVRDLADSNLAFPPGTRWQYSNIGFEVLADLIAKVSGEPFEQYMQRRIFTPLGMRHTTLLMTDVDSANLARGHVRDSTGRAVVSAVYPYNRPHAASSTLHSDLSDMLRWLGANLRKGELDGHRVLSSAAIDQMWTMAYDRTAEFSERARQSGRPMRYGSIGQGLGWRVFTLGGQNLVSHSGGDVGFRSDVLLWPAEGSAVVIMMNDEAGDPGELSRIVYALLRAEVGRS